MTSDRLYRFARLCSQLGGALQIVTLDAFRCSIGNAIEPAPFTHGLGVDYANRVVYVVDGTDNPGGVVHEMAHVFAGHSMVTHEWRFLGWEAVVARHLRCFRAWSTGHMLDYSVEDGRNWCEIDRDEQRTIIDERIRAATIEGLVSRCGHPLSVRG